MEKAYKYRIYPNKKQIELIHKTFGCVRYVYNYYLAKRQEVYEKESRTMGYNECSKDLTTLKKELEWLKEPDKCALQNSLKDLNAAYGNFFRDKSVGHPKFKSKKTHKFSYRTNNAFGSTQSKPSIEFVNNRIKLPKLGWLKTRDKQIPQGKILNATISQEPNGKYYVSICCTDVEIKPLPKTNRQIGIDLGIKEFCITSEGDKFYNPKYLAKSQKKLVKLQRELSRKTRGGRNWQKARIKVARQYEKISNQRRDYLQKLSTKLIRKNDVICTEDLNVSSMIENAKGANKEKANLRKQISDVSWYEFARELKYKAEWYGREIKQVDQYYASSQICHICGYKNTITKDLSVREWTCPVCGTKHDRDINAAINILQNA
ncbi:IS200/IS605 family element RNA-guided endonuclease TnpB [Lachnospira multipara]|uniref:Putative transposase n=1 Tax=Lachnospira multipara TaxID=28051 RepID=A0A1H5VQ25_9FIRM|nr:IS200/IS605 family element RNA-guided endonuclease TnpB [Lachnospira multipara]SEF89263.1 putative transposase [Lachnospira multipara]